MSHCAFSRTLHSFFCYRLLTRQVNDYLVQKELGKGAFAVVVLARKQESSEVALYVRVMFIAIATTIVTTISTHLWLSCICGFVHSIVLSRSRSLTPFAVSLHTRTTTHTHANQVIQLGVVFTVTHHRRRPLRSLTSRS